MKINQPALSHNLVRVLIVRMKKLCIFGCTKCTQRSVHFLLPFRYFHGETRMDISYKSWRLEQLLGSDIAVYMVTAHTCNNSLWPQQIFKTSRKSKKKKQENFWNVIFTHFSVTILQNFSIFWTKFLYYVNFPLHFNSIPLSHYPSTLAIKR